MPHYLCTFVACIESKELQHNILGRELIVVLVLEGFCNRKTLIKARKNQIIGNRVFLYFGLYSPSSPLVVFSLSAAFPAHD